jgi:hypothetical protein
MSARVEGFSDSRIYLIGRGAPEFDALLSARRFPGDLLDEVGDCSVFIANNSDRMIVAYSVRWEVGEEGTPRTQSFVDGVWASTTNLPLSDGVIAPGTKRFVSTLQGLEMLEEASVSGAVEQKAAQAEIRNRLIKSIRNLRARVKERGWRVRLDGVILDDGRCIGENKGQFFERIQARIEAARNFYRDLVTGLDQGLKLDAVLADLLATTEAAAKEAHGSMFNPDDFYKREQYSLAQTLVKSRDQVSEEDMVKAIRVENAKTRAVLYR